MTLQELAWLVDVELFVGDPATVADPLGVRGASPYAQACQRGVCALSYSVDCAYSVCHEIAHVMVGFEDEHAVLRCQTRLARLLDEPLCSRASTWAPPR